MNKLLLFSFVITCCLVGFSHSACTNKTDSVTPAAGVNTLKVAVDSSYSVQYTYYFTTDNTVQASVKVCSDNGGDFIGLSSDASAVTLTISPAPSTLPPVEPTPTTPVTVKPPLTVSSNAGRMSFSPLAAVMSICLACVFVFPKQRFSFFVVFVVVALAFYAPVSHAEKAASATVTISIGVPKTFSSVCVNGQCLSLPTFPYVISLNNKVFSTADQAAGSCSNGQPMTIPSGWAIAPYSDEASLVIVFNNWTASAIVTQGSKAYTNNKLNDETVGSYSQNGNTVSVADCSMKVLIIATTSFPLDPANTLVSTVAPTNFVTFGGVDYAAADNTAFGTATRASQTHAVYIQSTDAWQIATHTTSFAQGGGAAQVATQSQTNSFGADCIAMNFGNGINSYNVSSWAVCGSNDVQSVAYNGGYVYGVVRGSSYTTKMLVKRSSPSNTTANSWNTIPVPTETYTIGNVVYAMLDNAPVAGGDNGCQGRMFAMPSATYGWSYATDVQLATLMGDSQFANKWPSTTCFNNGVNSKSRDGTAGCAGSIVNSVGLSSTYVTSSQCSRTVIIHAKPTSSFTIGMKVAIITSTLQNANDSVVALAVSMMEARQIPYDVFYTTASTSSLALGSGANPLYYAIVFAESLIISCPNTALQAAINTYKFNYDVRIVALNMFPSAAQGVIIGRTQVSAVSNNFYLDSTFSSNFAEHVDGVVPTSMFEIVTGTSVYATVNPGYNAVAFLRATASNSQVASDSDDVIGTLVTNTDGTEELQFYAPLNSNAYAGPVLANVWISWMTRGLYLGYRRVYFNPQIDDLLLGTQQYSNDSDVGRMTGVDMALTAQWFEEDLKNQLPSGSYVTLTFGINGWGQLNVSAYSSTGDAYGIVPTAPHDELADSIVDFYDSFFWESHTFSHKDFTCYPEPDPDNPKASCQSTTSAATITNELAFNNQYFNEQLFKNFGGINAPRFSPTCFITPAITGLQNNPSSVNAIKAQNFTCVVGDNTRPVLIAPNPYDGLFTTNAVNGGVDGALFIIPRYATEVYYNTRNPHYLELEYNVRYGPNAKAPFKPFFDHDLSTDEIMAREAAANFLHLSALRHDPYMFHQCNLMHFPYTAPGDSQQKQWSLVTLWTKAVVDKYLSHMNLPMLSNKQNDLQDVYFARRARTACNISAKLTVNNGVQTSVAVTGNDVCTPIITGLTSCGSNSPCNVEQYGQDSTVYVTLPASKTATIPVQANTAW